MVGREGHAGVYLRGAHLWANLWAHLWPNLWAHLWAY